MASTLTSISAKELHELLQRDPSHVLWDVRTPVEYREVHATGAQNLPLDRIDPDKLKQSRDARRPVFVICRSGSRGKQACEKLRTAGFTNVLNVEGGTLAWEQAGLPVVRGKKAISLERQVRIAAGAIVLVGVGLGLWHPAFLGLSAFVGAGLIFSGVTDTCGMAVLLGRMPWNQCSRSEGCQS